MKRPGNPLENAVTLVTDISILNIIFLTFSMPTLPHSLAPLQIGYLPWLCCGLAGYLVNSAFLRRPRAVPSIAALNVLIAAGEASVLFLFSSGIASLPLLAVFVSAVLFSVGRGCYLVFNPVLPKQRLTYTEASFFLVLWFYFLQTGGISFPTSYDFILFFVLTLNLVVLAKFRITSGGENPNFSGRWTAFLMISVSAVLSLSLLLFTGFVSGGLRFLTSGTIDLIATVIGTVLNAAAFCFNFLLSLIPNPSSSSMTPPDEILKGLHLGKKKVPETSENPAVLMVLTVILAAAAVAGIVFLLFRFRRIRVSVSSGEKQPDSKKKRLHQLALLKRWLRAVLFRIRFLLISIKRRKTAAGLLLALEKFGSRRKLPRAGGETIRAYVNRLARSTALSEDGAVSPLFARLCDELDFGYYSGGADCPSRLSPAELSLMKKKIRKAGGSRFKAIVKHMLPRNKSRGNEKAS